MHYYIDGYNMLFRHMPSRNLQAERETLLDELNQKISLLNLDVSIVFDATFQEGGRSRSHLESLEILYSAEGETADEYIIDVISRASNPRSEVVVTNDKMLASHVRHFSAKVESVEAFMQWLNRSYQKRLRNPKKPKTKLVLPKFIPPAPFIPIIAPPFSSTISNDYERDVDYYQRIFEAEFQMIEEQKEKDKAAKLPLKKTRRPKTAKNPFQDLPDRPKKEATKMERWLKAFENRSEYNNGV